MDEATFDGKVVFIRHAYAERVRPLHRFVALSYEGIADEVEQYAFLNDYILGSEVQAELWDAVNLIGRRHLRRGDPLPEVLAHWIRDVLADQGTKRQKDKVRPRPPRSRRGGVRDQMIRLAIERLIAGGYKATRHRGPPEACAEGGTACDIAGAAFGHDYKNTERIWGSRSAAAPP